MRPTFLVTSKIRKTILDQEQRIARRLALGARTLLSALLNKVVYELTGIRF